MAQDRDRMLRWISGDEKTPARTLTEDQFIGEVLRLAEKSFATLPSEPMLVEGLDQQQLAVQWRAYLENPRDLLGLARQLAVERSLRHPPAPEAASSEKRDS